jgi:hypothetical protein
MACYELVFYTDMGHLLIRNQHQLPESIVSFAYLAIKQHIYKRVTDNAGIGCAFYVKKPDHPNVAKHKFNNCFVYLFLHDLDKLNLNKMVIVEE